jgi:very-short-patch-repair endonuclease/predicted transcriptional regulator of viral defense system
VRPKDRVSKLIAKQHGAVTMKQATDRGLTPDQVRQNVRSGRWIVSSRGTYIVAGAPSPWEQRAMTSQLAAGEAAAVSHLAAAWLHRMVDRPPAHIDITVPHSAQRGSHSKSVVVHGARTFGRGDIRSVYGIQVTCPSRTLVDIASVLPDKALAAALDTALMRGLVSIRSLRRYFRERRLTRRRGVGRLRELLDDREFGVPESQLEREFLELVREYRLPSPARQRRIGPHRVDFAYPSVRLLIEVDGRATHGTAEAFESDPVRQNALVLEGWTVLRFTWKQVTQDRDYVAATVQRALAATVDSLTDSLSVTGDGIGTR